jgi:SAM-dependent methyltransferase
MAKPFLHPVDRLTDVEVHDILLRVDTDSFPAKLEHLWHVEHVRYRETLRRIPPASEGTRRLLDLGSCRAWLPFFRIVLGYENIVLNTSYPGSGFVADGLTVRGARPADVRMSVFDVERDAFPHDDASFDVVCCLEVLEHLAIDPMAMMAEVNRVLRPGGALVLSTPNAVRYANIVNLLLGEQPYGWAPFNGFDGNRHNREYTPSEVERLFHAAGFTPREVTTFGGKHRGAVRSAMKTLVAGAVLPIVTCPPRWRRDVVVAVGHKSSPVLDRRPSWLYFDMAERAKPALVCAG